VRERKVIHVDMDAFYASIEQRDHPSLRGQPVIVGGLGPRGVVSAASYEARKFGVRSAMPMSQARKLCPRGYFLPVRMHRYRAVSRQIQRIFRGYTDLVEPVSLDESYLDVTENKLGTRSATLIAKQVKAKIRRELGLTASAGVGPNKFVAKIASGLQKPDGLVVVPPREVDSFLRDLPVHKVWGIGRVTERRLKAMGVETIGQLATVPVQVMQRQFGKSGQRLCELAHGRDDSPVSPVRERKSISLEHTFDTDVLSVQLLKRVVGDQAEKVAARARSRGLRARTVVLKVRYADFRLITRSRTLSQPVENAAELYGEALSLFGKTEIGQCPVRLVGVGLANFIREEEGRQLTLFEREKLW